MSRYRLVSFFVIVLLLAMLLGCNMPSNISVACNVADLIAAINQANANANLTTIALDEGCIYTLTAVDNDIGFGFLSPGESQANGLPAITTRVVISGDHDDPPIIRRSNAQGTPEFRFFFITAQGNLTLEAIVLENGLNAYAGGAIAVEGGLLTTDYVQFFDNASPGGAPVANTTGGGGGGAIENWGGTIVIHNNSFSGNSALGGGAIDNRAGGTITVDNFSLLNNNSAQNGGAVLNIGGTVTITGSHVSDNTATQSGGAIFNRGILVLEQVIFENNSQTGSGGGGAVANFTNNPTNFPAEVTATDCIFSGNAGIRGGAVDNVGGTVAITGGALRNNTAGLWGGAVFNAAHGTVDGSLTLAASLVKDNQAPVGGGIFNAGLMTVINTTLSGNAADEHGGAINNAYYDGNYGSLLVVGSTLAENTASGGAALANDGSLMTLNSTISGNMADYGAGLLNDGDALIVFSTIAYNDAYHGSGIYGNTGDVTVEHSLIGPNTAYNCMVNLGTITAQDANLSSDNTCPGFSIVADPLLAPLTNNGGLTMTHAPAAGSPALDAALDCNDNWGDPLLSDQRGGTRPQPVGGQCDLGAFELDLQAPLPPPLVDIPLLRVDMPAHCREGSSPRFSSMVILSPGQEVPLVGVNPSGSWYLVHPPDPGLDCWVWGEAVTPLGDLVRVPVVEDPPEPYLPPDVTEEPVPQQGCWVGSPTTGFQNCVVPCPAGAWPGGVCTP
ncbi:MAG: choice-of-anchor Q domain-containing protein [Chloroflexota bacterium]